LLLSDDDRHCGERARQHCEPSGGIADQAPQRRPILGERLAQTGFLGGVDDVAGGQTPIDLFGDVLELFARLLGDLPAQSLLLEREQDLTGEPFPVEPQSQLVKLSRKRLGATEPAA